MKEVDSKTTRHSKKARLTDYVAARVSQEQRTFLEDMVRDDCRSSLGDAIRTLIDQAKVRAAVEA